MLPITPRCEILVRRVVDFRKGIDSLAELCRAKLNADPFRLSVCVRSRGDLYKSVGLDGRDSGWQPSVCPKDAFVWPQGENRRGRCACIKRSAAAAVIRISCRSVWRKV